MSGRPFWTVKQIRAEDLRVGDTINRGAWRVVEVAPTFPPSADGEVAFKTKGCEWDRVNPRLLVEIQVPEDPASDEQRGDAPTDAWWLTHTEIARTLRWWQRALTGSTHVNDGEHGRDIALAARLETFIRASSTGPSG